MKYRKVLSRRTLLRGAGTVAIGLPFMECMRRGTGEAAAEPPVRAFNIFFGLGVAKNVEQDALNAASGGRLYAKALEPLEEVRDKIALLRGVHFDTAEESEVNASGNAHRDGAAATFVGTKFRNQDTPGGPSLDQVIRRGIYTAGQPEGVIPTLMAGTYFRRDRIPRYAHCFNGDGSRAANVMETPASLFTRIFGDGSSDTGSDPAQARAQRLRRSVLDSVVTQYQHYKSEAGGLGAASRARLSDHLESIREHEQRVFSHTPMKETCSIPSKPGASNIPHGSDADPGGQGIDITLQELVTEWRLMADLYALAVQCDLARFGGLTFQAAGERIRLTGRYTYNGKEIDTFDDRSRLGTTGAGGCSHEFWHKESVSRMWPHVHLMMNQIVYFMKKLDDFNYADENGKTILDNALVTISTESGWGNHSPALRELSNVFHVITGANGRFKTGGIIDVNPPDGTDYTADSGYLALDVYNTIVREGFGLGYKMGRSGRAYRRVDSIVA